MSALQDFYKVLKIHRNATQIEIKEAYRKLAFTLHPDRHDGCEIKTNQFKNATEAYQTLSDIVKRRAHDKILNGHIQNNSSRNSNNKNRNPPPPNYRKVYTTSPPPPGFKTFNAKYHYDMHYGDGMMKEEIERARKRAEAASKRHGDSFGYDYVSPLGKGFTFSGGGGGLGSGGNPYSKSGRRRMQQQQQRFDQEYEYEEGYMDLGNNSTSTSTSTTRQFRVRGREIISERMKERRKHRRRNRGDPLRSSSYSSSSSNQQQQQGDNASSCMIQ